MEVHQLITEATDSRKPCYHCGKKNHFASKCSFLEAVCPVCNKRAYCIKMQNKEVCATSLQQEEAVLWKTDQLSQGG